MYQLRAIPSEFETVKQLLILQQIRDQLNNRIQHFYLLHFNEFSTRT